MDLLARVRSYIREHDLIRPGMRVAAAVSGGSDSVALLQLLAELQRQDLLTLTGVIHFNHQLRTQADDDEAFVREIAASLTIPFVAERDDVRARARRNRQSMETAARAARYAFFDRARELLGAERIALGHTRDDQAETFLLRVLRGAGPRGWSAMHPRNGFVVRPLLDCGRSELREWLGDRGARFVDDLSNSDVRIPRNRVRVELMPLLTQRFNPSISHVLADQAAIARELSAWLDEASAPFLATPGTLDVQTLLDAPAALRRLVLWRALSQASGGRHVSFDHVAAVVRLISGERDGRLDLPGQTVQRIRSALVLTEERGSRRSTVVQPNFFQRPLSIPGTADIPEAGCVITACEEPDASRALVGSKEMAVVRRDLVRESLVVRNRRPGDKFRPLGLRGSKKLQDLFVDAKLPKTERDAVPVIADDSGRIIWVAGFGIDEAFRVTNPSQAVLVLRLTRS